MIVPTRGAAMVVTTLEAEVAAERVRAFQAAGAEPTLTIFEVAARLQR